MMEDSKITVPARLMKDQPRSHVPRRTLHGRGHMVGRQLHDEGSGLPGKDLGFLQNDTGDDDSGHADEVGRGCHPSRNCRTGHRQTSR